MCGRDLLAVEWVIMCSTEDNIELYMTAGRQRLKYLKKTAAVSHVRQWGLLVVRNHLSCRLNAPVKTVTESPEYFSHLCTLEGSEPSKDLDFNEASFALSLYSSVHYHWCTSPKITRNPLKGKSCPS